MKFSLAFSPCPNDTFIFDALVNQKIDTKGISFEVFLEDVQTLNEWAMQGKMDFSKISYGVWNKVKNQYQLLNSGGALGKGVGPLLITQPGNINAVNEMTIAIPGENTTAHLLFSLAYPNATKKVFKVFHEIENAVLNGEVDAGVIIHENRFTYQQKGLVKLMDLGEYWESTTQMPIPLGGIVVRRDIPLPIQIKINDLIRKSVEYAYQHTDEIMPYIRQYAQAMEDKVMQSHIDLYVNQYSIDLGPKGRDAVKKMFTLALEKHIIPPYNNNFFIN